MKETFKQNRFFLIPYFIIFSLLTAVVLIFPKSDTHLFINKFHYPFFNFFFKNLTHVGDGIFIMVVAAIFLLFSFRKGLMIAITYAISGLLAQFFKKVIFSDIVRPVKFFEGVADLNLVEGVKTLSRHSFPSGHSTTAFAFFFYLSIITKNPYIKLFWFFLATLVGFSRVYLSHHFLPDIVFGSFLGLITTFVLVLTIDNVLDIKILNRGLIKR